MSTVETTSGLSRTRRRTRAALVAAARELVTEGITPTVEETAARAEVSRTTAYRYFTNQTGLLMAAHPETGILSLLDEQSPDDPLERLDDVVARFVDVVLGAEPQQRTMLRLSLDPDVDGETRSRLPLRQGRGIGWFTEALEPLTEGWTEAERRRLACAVRATVGIEALVWLVDVAGLTQEDAAALMRWSARAVVGEALRSGPPEVPAG